MKSLTEKFAQTNQASIAFWLLEQHPYSETLPVTRLQWKREGDVAVCTFKSADNAAHFIYGYLNSVGVINCDIHEKEYYQRVLKSEDRNPDEIRIIDQGYGKPAELRLPLKILDTQLMLAVIVQEKMLKDRKMATAPAEPKSP